MQPILSGGAGTFVSLARRGRRKKDWRCDTATDFEFGNYLGLTRTSLLFSSIAALCNSATISALLGYLGMGRHYGTVLLNWRVACMI
jgi:hypothetical protein